MTPRLHNYYNNCRTGMAALRRGHMVGRAEVGRGVPPSRSSHKNHVPHYNLTPHTRHFTYRDM